MTLKDFIENNALFKKSKANDYFQSFANSQSPKATVVMCSDSRLQTDIIQSDAANQLFVIRNIGNQLMTTKGSIEYGILHLHTPLLIFIGHADCGAVKAAQSGYNSETQGIKQELDGLDVGHIKGVNEAIAHNIHHQVDHSLAHFRTEVDAKNLAVVGALYDFKNDFGQGHGALIILNINGEQDPGKIKNMDIIQGIEGAKLHLNNSKQ